MKSWKQIWHRLTLGHSPSPSHTASDHALALRLARVLEQIPACAIHVYVVEGHVTLCGRVASEDVLTQLLERVRTTPGVRSVKSSVHVLSTTPPISPLGI
ncbi:BON domain-containing protein [Rhodothermus bifroesti]|uniref:BON domain-containing protein n=1 Tax=Rhodothermus bifroesti TaxID=2823335 RepID=UPI00311A9AD3